MIDSISSKAGIEGRDYEDPAVWMEAAGLDPDPWQEDLLTGAWDRALLNITRQGGKSTTTAALGLETALSASNSLVLILAPARRQSRELLQKVRLMYWDAMPSIPIEKLSELRIRFGNGSRIIALPGKEATIRGYSAVDLVLADEAARVPDNLYRAVRPMLAVSDGRLVAMSTPRAKRGWFYESWIDPEQEWERVKVTGYDCPRLSDRFLKQERREMPEAWFRSEYLCEFRDAVNSVFSTDDLDRMVTADVPPLFDGEEADIETSEEIPTLV